MEKTREARQHGRRQVKADASLRAGDGAAHAARVVDLSAAGCRVEMNTAGVDPDEVVVVGRGALAGLEGTVRWTDGKQAGVEFADPLHPAVVDHVTGERELVGHAPVPPRRSDSGFTDGFGRPLPSLGAKRRH